MLQSSLEKVKAYSFNRLSTTVYYYRVIHLPIFLWSNFYCYFMSKPLLYPPLLYMCGPMSIMYQHMGDRLRKDANVHKLDLQVVRKYIDLQWRKRKWQLVWLQNQPTHFHVSQDPWIATLFLARIHALVNASSSATCV